MAEPIQDPPIRPAQIPRVPSLPRKVRPDRRGPISQIHYRQIKRRMGREKIRALLILLVLAGALGLAIFWYGSNQKQGLEIKGLADTGLTLLEQNRYSEAAGYLRAALERYSGYHADHPEWWMESDAVLFSLMIRAARGFGRMGDYENGLRAFEQAARHNAQGPDNWVGRLIDSELVEFIGRDNWPEADRPAIYACLTRMDPESWKTGAIFQARVTERAGLYVVPMSERLRQADGVAYGKPRPLEDPWANEMEMDAIRFYQIEHRPGRIVIRFPLGLPDYGRRRLAWYAKSDRECLVFVKFEGHTLVLTGLEGILLSEIHNVDIFNTYFR